MFTGIVEEIGKIISIKKSSGAYKIGLEAKEVSSDALIGDSIAINGVCLTVTDINKLNLYFDAVKETLDKTNLGSPKEGSLVNLERSLKLGARLGGHFVSGHIDYKAKIKSISKESGNICFNIITEPEFLKFIVKKGSVTIDGVSLTVGEAYKGYFSVFLIPHTLEVTTLGEKKAGDFVNIETDLIGKYILNKEKESNMMDTLKKYGYIS